MKSAKNQAVIMIGVGLIFLAFIMLYYAFSQPEVASNLSVASYAASSYDETSAASGSASKSSESASYASSDMSYSYSSNDTQTQAADVSYPVNLNTCTADELSAIDGIGDSRAQAIIQYREYLGSYSSVEQIKEIKGIGDAIYEKVSPYLTV